MFSIKKEYSKKVIALLSGKEITKKATYIVPQFGPEPEKAENEKYTPEETMQVVNEALAYFGNDDLVRFLNWAVIVYAQRTSNNDLRATATGLSKADEARVQLLKNMAIRQAEAECGTYNDKGELVIDRKSDEYLAAIKESLEFNTSKPKYADLKKVFEGDDSNIPPIDLTIPGSMSSSKVEDKATDAPKAEETTESAATEETVSA